MPLTCMLNAAISPATSACTDAGTFCDERFVAETVLEVAEGVLLEDVLVTGVLAKIVTEVASAETEVGFAATVPQVFLIRYLTPTFFLCVAFPYQFPYVFVL